MCNVGIPVLDVFQMTESAPTNDKKAVINNIEKILTQYFKRHPYKECVKKTKVKHFAKNNGTTSSDGNEETTSTSFKSKEEEEEFPTLLKKNLKNM